MTSACPACDVAPIAVKTAARQDVPSYQFSLPTIHCAACIGKVERGLAAVPGITNARVNLSLKRLSVFANGTVSPDHIMDVLGTIGFEAHPLDAGVLEQAKDIAGRALLTRLAIAGFAMMNVMLLSVAVWSGAADATRDLFHLISALIALPVIAYSAQPFFQHAWSALKVRSLNMDVPISLAIILAAGMSLYETLQGGRHAYFDAALSLTFFLLIGRYLDHRTRSAARSAAKELSALEVHAARRITGGVAETVAIADLSIGDLILAPTGTRIPVDGVLGSTSATLDRSFLTGESAAVIVARGDAVQAGEINLGAPIRMTVTAVGADTTLRRIATLVELAETGRNSYTALADRAAQIYAPMVHLLALAAFIGWYWIGGDVRHALNIAIAVLIITCPCALGLAVPAVSTAAIGRLFSMGFLVKHATALERLAEVDSVVFDKTGTLTLPEISNDISKLSGAEKSVALSLAQQSNHPASKAIAMALQGHGVVDLSTIREVAGQGIEARYEGVTVRLGKGCWLGADFAQTGLRIGEGRAKPLRLNETLRPGVPEALRGFEAAQIPVEIMTGDTVEAANAIASELGLATVSATISGEEKYARLRALADTGQHVLMVGDGLNDTAALAVAHASIAPSSALDASRSAADIVVLKDSFAELPLVLRLAKATRHLSKQNFQIAAIYNLIAVPIALLGFATPLAAALAMSASSITVLANSQRIRRV